jgi:pyruvate dehydrogenase E2 component (dihydrolipoamide acetyltransferase)
MPKMGIDMVDGSIASWLKDEGDTVTAGEAIAEIETDKATIEMEASASGVLLKIVVPPDELVAVGALLAYIGEAGESLPESLPESAGSAVEAAAAPEEAPAASALSEAAPASTAEVKVTPVAKRMAAEEGINLSTVTGSGPEGRITKEDIEKILVDLMNQEPPPPNGVKASPAARRIAREKGYNIAHISGTGPDGRIVMRDVEAYQPVKAVPAPRAAPKAPKPAVAAATVPPASLPVAAIGTSQDIPLTRMRKRITQVLTASKAPIPHFYVTMDIDMGAAIALRKQMNATLAEEGLKISFNDLIVKATALALKKYPNLNSSFAGDKIVQHGDINVGVAVSTDTGLLTIATRNTDKLALSELSQLTRARAGRARSGKVQADDLGGTTFTVSNLGMYGVDSFVAIITPPEAAILAVAGIRQEAVVKDGQIVIGNRMKVTLSADHRVTDGAEGAQFMVELKRLLENPMRLML